ncbi:hypothetical protein [Pseudonocardia sp.]|uniref:hypothetical protein n=1 Tax=Pseudonocardia sp. TaxID=60912 RepID=UPI0031FD5B21
MSVITGATAERKLMPTISAMTARVASSTVGRESVTIRPCAACSGMVPVAPTRPPGGCSRSWGESRAMTSCSPRSAVGCDEQVRDDRGVLLACLGEQLRCVDEGVGQQELAVGFATGIERAFVDFESTESAWV